MSTVSYRDPDATLAAAQKARETRQREGRLLPDEALDEIAAIVKASKRPTPTVVAIGEAVAATGRKIR